MSELTKHINSQLSRQLKALGESGQVTEILNNLPIILFIVNEHGQILFANQLTLKKFGFESPEQIIGKKPGDAIRCVFSLNSPIGCGSQSNCTYCGVFSVIEESRQANQTVNKEALLMVTRDNENQATEVELTCCPVDVVGEQLFILTLTDVSSKKRKEQLEQVFFHDLMNKVGFINGLSELLIDPQFSSKREKTEILMRRGIKDLIKEISFQKDFYQAESGELETNFQLLHSGKILQQVVDDFWHLTVDSKKTVSISADSEDFSFLSDYVLLNRILTNLVKNALEAIKPGEWVQLTAQQKQDSIFFIVSNPSVIPPDIQLQIFKRSFSTKGTGRGIGTYSVKLFVENYLGGRVSFESLPETGTRFIVQIPDE